MSTVSIMALIVLAMPPPRHGSTAIDDPRSLATGVVLPQPPSAAGERFHSRRVLVRFKTATSAATKRISHDKALAGRVLKDYRSVPDLHLVEVPPDGVLRAVEAYRLDPNVRYAEPDFAIELAAIPRDPLFGRLAGLHNKGQMGEGPFCHATGRPGADIRAVGAWDIWTGDRDFRIAIVDTGVNYLHPDLIDNIWTNPGEIPDNGQDDDGNGWIDDVHGYDIYNNDSDPMDDRGHGTHVAGIIGAVGDNGLGVVGVNWRCQIVAIKIFGPQGILGHISDAVEAMDYVIVQGIRVSNHSWGISQYSQAFYDMIEASQYVGHILVTAAGNDFGADNDRVPRYPTAYDLPNIIAVTATDNRDGRANFANVGRQSVDLGAPGACVDSTVLGSGYALNAGTSMAAPYVTGVVALVMSRWPELSWRQVRERVLLTARPVNSLRGVTVTGGVVNAMAAIGDCNESGTADEQDIAEGFSEDCTGNGIPDECEPDCNADGIADSCDSTGGPAVDCNDNGIPDECEPDCNNNEIGDACDLDGAVNCNRNYLPDPCEADCNNTGTPDDCDIRSGASQDCNEDGIPEECEPDCNENKIADPCDIRLGFSTDCTADGIPDECEPDCNENGRADSCDIAFATSADCDGDAIPDECESDEDPDCNRNARPDSCDISGGDSRDCNSNLAPDECDIDAGGSADADGNGVPDECDGRGFTVIPVGASGPHSIEGREIVLPAGGQRVTLEIRLSGWDLNRDGHPRLRAYAAQIEASGFTSGGFGELAPARIACSSDDDCRLGSTCGEDRHCDVRSAAYIDGARPDFVFADLVSVRIVNAVTQAPDLWFVGSLWDQAQAIVDQGIDNYAATLVLDVSPEAGGRFTVGFDLVGTMLRAGLSVPITIPSLNPAVITVQTDCNANGMADHIEIDQHSAQDCNGNGIPDECVGIEPDCNDNGRADDCEIMEGVIPDCNDNGIPDSCDIAVEPDSDCNENGIPDECIEHETDCDLNGSPDACDIAGGIRADCNGNAVPDLCDVNVTSEDCNRNGVPDECISLERDCNQNLTPDSCDVRTGASSDEDHNGVPDECAIVRRVPGQYLVIQEAIDHSMDGDVISVADGVYRGDGNFNLDFAGRSITVRSENGPARCRIDCGGAGRGFHFHSGESRAALLVGFTITGGSADFGGALACSHSRPTVENCVLTGNIATDDGGGIYFGEDGDALILHCTLSYNVAGGSGGGVACNDAAPALRYCMLRDNRAGVHGGGIHLWRSDDRPNVASCTITGNRAGDRGGAIRSDESNPLIRHCTVTGNLAQLGGGISCTQRLLPSSDFGAIIRDSIFWDNRAYLNGNQIALGGASRLTVNFSDVQAGLAGAYLVGSTVLHWPQGNLNQLPGFIEPGEWFDAGTPDDLSDDLWINGDHRLAAGSPCIQAGDPQFRQGPEVTDFEGHSRLLCTRVDLGAFEFGIGDFDCNARVDSLDFFQWRMCSADLRDEPYPAGCESLDFDFDGDVDLRDFAGLQVAWTGPGQ